MFAVTFLNKSPKADGPKKSSDMSDVSLQLYVQGCFSGKKKKK